ncbi:hypothetical protein AB444_12250 [Listeria monocytogenes]|nr:hypothetical protein [Listeria monocytogenes]EAG5504028.1 hypothetical protein [Listeria monocytogenes]EHG1790646.1 hypothetical protein [Listeria monocytogenes]
MREIEFRGQNINGHWAHGNLAIIKEKLDRAEIGAYISNSAGAPFAYQVRPETIGQYTGLKDKNGKKIFEGDIVINSNGQIGYIAFLVQEAGFVVVLKNSDYRLGHRNTNECYERATHHKIIGNIHENPELLEA